MTKFQAKINGEQFDVEQEFYTANQLLELAKKHKAIPNDPENYILESVDKGTQFQGNDKIDLSKDSTFTAIPKGPTPVA